MLVSDEERRMRKRWGAKISGMTFSAIVFGRLAPLTWKTWKRKGAVNEKDQSFSSINQGWKASSGTYEDSHCISRDGQIVMVEKGKKEGHGNCSKNE